MKRKSKLLHGVALFILGIAFLSGGVYLLKVKMEFFNRSIKVDGIILEVESSKSRSTTYYHLVISFQALDGNTYTFSSETGSSAAFDFNKGDKIAVRYTEEDPQKAKVDSIIELWALPLALLLVGIVLSAVVVSNFYRNSTKETSN